MGLARHPEASQMAWLEEQINGRFKIVFRYKGEKFKKSLKTTNRSVAEGLLGTLEERQGLLERGQIPLPPGADLGLFLLHPDPAAAKKLVVERPQPEVRPPDAAPLTLEELYERYR